jgi:hypothetical protein
MRSLGNDVSRFGQPDSIVIALSYAAFLESAYPFFAIGTATRFAMTQKRKKPLNFQGRCESEVDGARTRNHRIDSPVL